MFISLIDSKMTNAYQENDSYFRQAYQKGDYHWTKVSCAIVAEYLDCILGEKNTASFLDIGCGEGANVRLAAEKGLRAVGLDREELAIESAIAQAAQGGLIGSTGFLNSDALDLPFPQGSFDVILDHGCLHHLRKGDWKKYKEGILFVLKPESHYILEVFSTEHKGYGKIPTSRWHIKDKAYRRFFTKDDVEEFCGDNLDILDIREKRGPIAGDWHALMKRKD